MNFVVENIWSWGAAEVLKTLYNYHVRPFNNFTTHNTISPLVLHHQIFLNNNNIIIIIIIIIII
jgi:hypothetical protein